MRDLAAVEEVTERRDLIRAWPACALHATLGLPGEPPGPGEPLPPLWRWFYFLDAVRRSAIGPSGAGDGGGIFGGGAKYWIGGRLEFRKPLLIGRTASLVESNERRRRAELGDGPVEILTQRLDVAHANGLAEVEERDFIRRVGRGSAAPPIPMEADGAPAPKSRWRRRWAVDAPLLFRFSALLFDSNRLHYDLDYCRSAAGLPGLLAPTPLLALLLLETAREKGPDRAVARFSYRLRGLLTHLDAFAVCGRATRLEDGGDGAELWIETESAPKRVVMTATLAFG